METHGETSYSGVSRKWNLLINPSSHSILLLKLIYEMLRCQIFFFFGVENTQCKKKILFVASLQNHHPCLVCQFGGKRATESRFKSSLPESLNTRDETEHTTISQLFLPKKEEPKPNQASRSNYLFIGKTGHGHPKLKDFKRKQSAKPDCEIFYWPIDLLSSTNQSMTKREEVGVGRAVTA